MIVIERMRHLAAGSAVLTSILFGALPASAQTASSAPSNTEMTEAETRFQEGLALYEKGNINEARVKLVQAYAVLGRPNILWNLAVAEFYSSRTLDSIRHMRKLLQAPDADARDVKLAREKFLPALEKVTGRIAITAPKGVSVTVDGEPVGVTPIAEPVDVLPGRHVVVASGQTGTWSSELEVLAGQSVTTTLGSDGDPGNGSTGGSATSSPPAASAEEPLDTETSSPAARNVTVIALGGAALLAAGAGFIFLAKAGSSADDAASIRASLGGNTGACSGAGSPDCTRLRDATEAEASDRDVSTGFFLGAGALAVAAGATYLLWPKATSTTPRAAMIPQPGGARLVIGASF